MTVGLSLLDLLSCEDFPARWAPAHGLEGADGLTLSTRSARNPVAQGFIAVPRSNHRRGVAQFGQSSGLQTRTPQVQILPPLRDSEWPGPHGNAGHSLVPDELSVGRRPGVGAVPSCPVGGGGRDGRVSAA